MTHASLKRNASQISIDRTAGRLAAVLLACLPLLGGCDSLLSAEKRIDRAQQEYAAGDYSAAMNDVKTALSAEPDNIEGRLLLARVSLRIGDAAAARKELDSAIALGAESPAVRELHYAILLAQNRYEDALISAAADDDFDPLRRLVVMARAELALGKLEEAEASVSQALEAAPQDREAVLVQGLLYFTSGRLDESRATLDALLEREPDYAEAWVLRGRVALAMGDNTRAGEAFDEAKERAASQLGLPQQAEILVALVETKLALGDTAGADVDMAALRQRAPNAFATRYMMARLAYAKGENKAAIAELQRALGQRPDIAPARLLLGAALLADGSAEQAEAELNQLLADHPDNIEARKLLARLYLSRNDPAAARRVLEGLPDTAGVDSGVDWLTGTVLMLSGQSTEAIVRLEQGAAADPANIPLRLDLVQAYLIAGRREKAIEVLGNVPADQGGAKRRRLAILVEVAGRSPAEARPRIERLAEEHADDAEMLSLAAAYLFEAGDSAGAAKLFEKAIAADPKLVPARIGLARTALQLGEVDRADEQLRRVLELDRTSEPAHIGLAYVAIIRGDRAAAKDWLERAVGANPSAMEARFRLAEMALVDGDAASAKALADQALAVSKAPAATMNRLGTIYLSASRYDEALRMFNDSAAQGYADAEVNAGITLLAQGRTDEARARFESAAKDRRDWSKPLFYLVSLDSSEKRFDPALKRISDFEKAGGQSFVAEEIRGEVYLAAGRPADALDAYRRAAAARPSSSLAAKAFRAARAAGRPNPEADLKVWLDQNPQDSAVRALLAEHYHQAGNRKAAIAEYERAVQSAPPAMAMNNLAWLYYETGDGRAEDLARRAHDAAPDNAAIADTYGWILVEKGKVKEGLPVLEAAAKGRPQDRDILYHHAAALARDGQKKVAAGALRSLLADSQVFASRAEAQALLDKLSREELGL